MQTTTTLLAIFSFLFLAHIVSANTGTVSIWAHHSIRDDNTDHVLELKVYVNDRYHGMITRSFSDEEMDACGMPGSVTLKLRAGQHNIQVRGIHRDRQDHNRQQTIEWGGQFTIEEDVCTMVRVAKDEDPLLVEDKCETTGEVGIYLAESMRSQVRDIKIYIDGEYAASLNQYHASDRTCGDKGVLTRKLSCGPHTVVIEGIRKNPKPNEGRKYRATSSFVLDGQCMVLRID